MEIMPFHCDYVIVLTLFNKEISNKTIQNFGVSHFIFIIFIKKLIFCIFLFSKDMIGWVNVNTFTLLQKSISDKYCTFELK